MKIKISNADGFFAVPNAVKNCLPDSDGVKLKVLLYIFSTPDFDEDELCDDLNITKKSMNTALTFWCEQGIIERESKKTPKKSTLPKEKIKDGNVTAVRPHPMARAAELPKYSADEIAAIMEKGGDKLSDLLFACQQTLGKMFNVAETEVFVGLTDYLSLDYDYILLLFTHCGKIGKKSLRYIEKLALGLFDKGILAYDELDAHLTAAEEASKSEAKLRKLFGIQRRALLKKESDAFANWVGVWKFPFDVIEKAYEITVENTGNASVPYCNAVLERWHETGLATVENVNEAIAEYRHDKEGMKDKKGSFDTDDFFEAALARSYRDEKEPEKTGKKKNEE